MDQKDWQIIVNLYEEKNITRTAKKLYISQPSLTYRIKQIEEEFKTQIIHRANKGVIFTSEGEILVQYAKQMLGMLQSTKEKISNLEGEMRGTLRLGASSNFALYELPDLLEGFINRYPDIDIQLNTGWSSRVVDYLNTEEIHVGILRGEHIWKGTKEQLKHERLFVVSKNKVDLSELPNLNYIRFNTDIYLKNTFESWWRATFDVPPKITMELDRIETCKELVKRGIGYSLMPEISLKEEDGLHTIELKVDDNPIIRDSWLVYREDLMDLNIVNAFINYTRKYYNIKNTPPFSKGGHN